MENQYQTIMIPLKEVYSDNDFNCRGPIAPIDVAELAQDIQMNGLQFPITVQPAEDVENAGYHRFASTRRNLAASYEDEAKQIIEKLGLTKGLQE